MENAKELMMPLTVFSQDMDTLSNKDVYVSTKIVLNESFTEIEINGYKYGTNEVWDVLLYASANHLSINATCEALEGAPSSNWMYNLWCEFRD